jgi:hypothetical protein
MTTHTVKQQQEKILNMRLSIYPNNNIILN